MAKNDKRVKVTLACEDCKRRNYITMKSKVNDRERIEMKKYCRWDSAAHASTRRRASRRRGRRLPRGARMPVRNLSAGQSPNRSHQEVRLDEAELVGAARGATARRSTSWCGAPSSTRSRSPVASPVTRRTRGTWCRTLICEPGRASASSGATRSSPPGCTASPPTRGHQHCRSAAPPARRARSATTSSRSTTERRAARSRRGPSRPKPSSASPPRSTISPRSCARGRPERRLRAVARSHRRRARHLGLGREGAAAPGAAQVAGRVVRREEPRRPMRCDEVTALLPGARRRRGGRDSTVRTPRRDVPAMPGRARALPPAAAHAVDAAHRVRRARRPGLLGETLAVIDEAAERGARSRSLLSGRRLAYAGASAAARRRRGSRRRCSSPGRAARVASPLASWRAAASAGSAAGPAARTRCYPRARPPRPGGQ